MKPSKKQAEVLTVLACEGAEIKTTSSGISWTMPIANGRFFVKVPAATIVAMRERGWIAANAAVNRYSITNEGRAAIGKGGA